MSDTATVAPVPSGRELFYAALSRETGGAAAGPKSQGQQFQTPESARRIEMMAQQHAKANAPKAAPAAVGVSVDTVKAYQANKGKPAPSVVLDGSPGQVDRVIADMRGKGEATGTDTAAAKDALIALKRSTPMAQQTHAWKSEWERKFAAADAAAEAKPAEAKPVAVATAASAPSPAVDSGINFVMKNSNAEGMMVSHSIPKSLLSGYTLPSGAKIHAETAIRMLRDARADGVPQSVVDAYVRALK